VALEVGGSVHYLHAAVLATRGVKLDDLPGITLERPATLSVQPVVVPGVGQRRTLATFVELLCRGRATIDSAEDAHALANLASRFDSLRALASSAGEIGSFPAVLVDSSLRADLRSRTDFRPAEILTI